MYLGAWRVRTMKWLDQLPLEQIDVATAAFLVFALIPTHKLAQFGREVMEAQRERSVVDFAQLVSQTLCSHQSQATATRRFASRGQFSDTRCDFDNRVSC